MPKIGLRNVKTAISVAICLGIYFIIIIVAKAINNDWTESVKLASTIYTPFFACLAAAYSVGNGKANTMMQAKLRLIASVIGGLVGVAVVALYIYVFKFDWPFSKIITRGDSASVEIDGRSLMISFIPASIVVAISVVLTIWLCNLFKQKNASFIAVLTLCAVMTSLGTEPVIYGFNRILSTMLGIVIALGVNNFRLPRFKNKNNLFVVSMDGVFVKDNDQINGFNAFKVNDLLYIGTNITYFSTRTPVSLMPIIGDAKLNIPVICMSGAALYDVNNKKFLYVENLDIDVSVRIKEFFKMRNISPFYNLVIDDVLYTYNEKLNNDGEKIYAKNRKNSAYGCYIPGEYPHTKDVCYIMVVDKKEVIEDIKADLLNTSYASKIAIMQYDCYEITGDEDTSGYSYLKIYSSKVYDMNALKMLNSDNKKIIACGCHNYDKCLLEFADYSFTTLNASTELMNSADKVLNTKNNEKMFREIGRLYRKKELPNKTIKG